MRFIASLIWHPAVDGRDWSFGIIVRDFVSHDRCCPVTTTAGNNNPGCKELECSGSGAFCSADEWMNEVLHHQWMNWDPLYKEEGGLRVRLHRPRPKSLSVGQIWDLYLEYLVSGREACPPERSLERCAAEWSWFAAARWLPSAKKGKLRKGRKGWSTHLCLIY